MTAMAKSYYPWSVLKGNFQQHEIWKSRQRSRSIVIQDFPRYAIDHIICDKGQQGVCVDVHPTSCNHQLILEKDVDFYLDLRKCGYKYNMRIIFDGKGYLKVQRISVN